MKSLPKVIVALFAVLALSNCGGPSHEKLADEMMDLMGEFADTIASVKDEASSDKAVAKLEKIAEKMKAVAKQAREMAEPPADVKERIEGKMKARQEEVQEKMKAAMGSILSNPAVAQKIVPAMEKIGKIMED